MALAVVGVLAIGIGMVHKQTETASLATLGVLDHLHVGIGITESEDRTLADVLVDANWFACLVIDEVNLGSTHQNRFAILDLEFRDDAGANDLRRRNAIDPSGPRPHELNAAAGDNKGPETASAKVGQQFELRLVDTLGVKPIESRMLGSLNPLRRSLLELFGGHAGVGGHHHLNEALLAGHHQGLHITLEHRFEGLGRLPFPDAAEQVPPPGQARM